MSNAELRAGSPLSYDDPDGIAELSAPKRSTLLANPLLGGDDEPARLLGIRDERVVGRLDLVAGRFETVEGTVPCFWGSALLVPSKHRHTLVGVSLVLAQQRLRDAAAACGVSRLSHPLFTGLRWRDVPLPRFILVRKTRSLVERRLGGGFAARATRALADSAIAGQHALLRAVRSVAARGLEAEPAAAFPPELEPRLVGQGPTVATHRSAAWLDWVLHESFLPQGEHRRALFLVRDRAGEVVAYFLLKQRAYENATKWDLRDLELASLVDWRIFEPRALRFDQLVLLALDAGRELRPDAFEVCVTPEFDSSGLRPFGFVRAGAQHLVVRAPPASLLSTSDSASWLVRPGDGDHVFS